MDKEITIPSQKELQLSKSGDDSAALTPEEFAGEWAKLCAAYPKNDTSSLTVEVYYYRLYAYKKTAVLEAIGDCIDECKWFPAISEIVERIKSPRGCIHRLQLAEIASRERMLIETEKHSDRRLKQMAEQIAALEDRRPELYAQQKAEIEASGLPEAQARLDAIKEQIIEQQRVLNTLRAKVKLVDQARLMQADDTDYENWIARKPVIQSPHCWKIRRSEENL